MQFTIYSKLLFIEKLNIGDATNPFGDTIALITFPLSSEERAGVRRTSP
jgi:hypothetical protein